MKRILLISVILATVLLSACVAPTATKSPTKTTPAPTQIPSLAPIQDDSFTIRVTGSARVFDQLELDRRWGEAKAKYDRLIEESRNKEMAEFKTIAGLPLDEYKARNAEMTARYNAERETFQAEYFTVLKAPNDDLYSDSPNVKFSGSYMVITSGGQTTSRSVDGTTPAEYTVKGYIVSCIFQKASEYGSLSVEIIKDGKVIASEYTTADYGVVSVATQ